MKLNEKIGEILKRHKEGEEFFNALDYTIRGDRSILEDFYNFAWNRIFINSTITSMSYNLILSGRFGMSLLSNYGSSLYRSFNNVIITNGNIRKGELPEIYKNDFNEKPFIFLDDSFYSGKTRDSIQIELFKIEQYAKIEKTFVIYDGSLQKQDNVYSLYRYHK